MENHRICCVCLNKESTDEDATKFAPVFNNNTAKLIYNISGVHPFEWANGTPTLICASCENDVISADFVRVQVIKGQKHLAEMNVKTEKKMIHKNRKELVLNNPSFPFTLSKSTLEKAKAWKRSQKLLEVLEKADKNPPKAKATAVKPELVSPRCAGSSEVVYVAKKTGAKREKQAAIPVKKFTGKKEKKTVAVIQEIHQETKPGIKTEKMKAKRKQVPTSFECDSCYGSFSALEQLNMHMESHNNQDDEVEKTFEGLIDKLLEDETDPTPITPIYDSPPMIISQIHEGMLSGFMNLVF